MAGANKWRDAIFSLYSGRSLSNTNIDVPPCEYPVYMSCVWFVFIRMKSIMAAKSYTPTSCQLSFYEQNLSRKNNEIVFIHD